MAQTKTEIQQILQSLGGEPRKRFGQNFMIDQNLLGKVRDAGNPRAGDLVIEVGPGTGTLTEELLASGAEVLAVEIDRDLARMLRERFSDQPNFGLLEGDALAGKHAINEQLATRILTARSRGTTTKLIANLPYNIASPLVIELLMVGVELLAFTVQKEVAARLRAPAGSEDYGPLSVVAQMLGQVELLRSLPPQAFWPAPKVESSLVRITRADQLGADARAFSAFIHALFSARRKTLRKAMIQAGFDPATISDHDMQQRVEVLTPLQLLNLWLNVRRKE